MKVYLIRHGQSEENLKGWSDDNSNSPLTDLGHAQAKAMAAWLASQVNVTTIHTSTMQRARQTANYLTELTGLPTQPDHRLREIGCNRGDGSPLDDLNLPKYKSGKWANLQPYQPVCDGAENWMQFRARIGNFIEYLLTDLPEKHNEVAHAVVCHGGVIEGFFDYVFERGPHSAVFVNTNNTGITLFEYLPNNYIPNWRINFHNRLDHLTTELIS